MSAPTDRTSASEADAARRLDRAIDDLLADGSGATGDEDPLTGTALVLGSRLPRLHPRFGFEERLAHRLREVAAAPSWNIARPRSDGEDEPSTIVPFPHVDVAASEGLEAMPRSWHPGRLSLIGAIASAVSLLITLAGAGLVIRRRIRGADPSEGIA